MAENETFTDKVEALVAKAEKNDRGALVISEENLEGASEELAFAATTQLQYKNTQSQYTKSQQNLAASTAVNEKLTEHIHDTITLKLTEEQKVELSTLKLKDPDEWKKKLEEYEVIAKTTLATKLKQIDTEGAAASELELRKAKVVVFNNNTGIKLTDTFIKKELPSKYTEDLENGIINFDEFLTRTKDFLTKNRVIQDAGEADKDEINLNKAPGGSEPSQDAQKGDFVEKYKKQIF